MDSTVACKAPPLFALKEEEEKKDLSQLDLSVGDTSCVLVGLAFGSY